MNQNANYVIALAKVVDLLSAEAKVNGFDFKDFTGEIGKSLLMTSISGGCFIPETIKTTMFTAPVLYHE